MILYSCTTHIFYVKYKDIIMESLICHGIEDIYINDRKSICNIQNLQDNIAFTHDLPVSLFGSDLKEH
jgi:hypothetical protein